MFLRQRYVGRLVLRLSVNENKRNCDPNRIFERNTAVLKNRWLSKFQEITPRHSNEQLSGRASYNIQTCTPSYIRTCIHEYMHTYIHTDIHAHLHTCIDTRLVQT